MRHPGRTDEEAWWKAFAGGRPLAWKTGTSFGNRDAWSIGVAPGWVVAVWAGNPTGEGRTGLWGTQSSVPLLFRLFALLPQDRPWFPTPTDLVPVKVCHETGARATALCSTSTVMAPAAGVNAPTDRFHRTLHLDRDGFQVNAGCEPPSQQIARNFLVLPPVVDGLWRQDHPMHPPLPPWRTDCKDGLGTNDLEILYPEPGALVRMPKGLRGNQKLVLEARHRHPEAKVRCFLDQTDLGLSDRFLTWTVSPEPGKHTFTCVDEEGHEARVHFTVDFPRL
jgi:penicillin-binding protein 1C